MDPEGTDLLMNWVTVMEKSAMDERAQAAVATAQRQYTEAQELSIQQVEVITAFRIQLHLGEKIAAIWA